MAKGDEKARRMELRRAVGNREVHPLPVRTPGARYLVAHACFACRRSFKVAPRTEQAPAVCPCCRGKLYEMGRSFKTPRRDDIEQWAKVQLLYAHGFRFFSYRSFDCPPLPERLAEVEQFVRENPQHPSRVGTPNLALQRTPPAAASSVESKVARAGGSTELGRL